MYFYIDLNGICLSDIHIIIHGVCSRFTSNYSFVFSDYFLDTFQYLFIRNYRY